MRSKVVLPQPDGPSSAKNSFWAMSNDDIVDGLDAARKSLGDIANGYDWVGHDLNPLPDFSGA